MDIKELQNKTIAALHKELAQKRDELRELRFKLNQDEVKNVRQARALRKTIAKILTVLNQKRRILSRQVSRRD